jgi:hypothetical protein
MRQRIIAFLLAVIMIGAVLMAFCMPILRSFSTVLMAEDKLEKVEAMAVPKNFLFQATPTNY